MTPCMTTKLEDVLLILIELNYTGTPYNLFSSVVLAFVCVGLFCVRSLREHRKPESNSFYVYTCLANKADSDSDMFFSV